VRPDDRATATEPARPRPATRPAAPGPGGLHRAHGLRGPAAAAFERGVTAYNADDVDAAVEAFEEAVRLAPESAEAHINLGFVYLRLQRTADAIREIETGDRLARPDRPPATGEADPDGNKP
jgi:tetratricopeptide (TPR) repeat protein